MFIEDYVTNGTSSKLYMQRTSILMKLYDAENNAEEGIIILNCHDNLASCVTKVRNDLS